MAPRPKPERWRVEDRGHDSPCWTWLLAKDHAGYGQVNVPQQRRMTVAHRFYYEEARGPVADDVELDHLCRNRDCVNPDHLEPVTRQENVRRGRLTKLTVDKAREIRNLIAVGWRQQDIADAYGVSQGTVSRIKLGIRRGSWKEETA